MAKANDKSKGKEVVEGLEDNKAQAAAPTAGINYADLDFLTNNEPSFPEEHRSSKYDEEREPKVQHGLGIIMKMIDKDQLNPLVVLLAKWWEVKPARAAIKDMIDAEAEKAGVPSAMYLQVNLRKGVEELAEIQNAVNRLKYSINYFKPRGGLLGKETYKTISIDGVHYRVGMNAFTEMKERYGDDKAGLKKEAKATFEKIVIEDL